MTRIAYTKSVQQASELYGSLVKQTTSIPTIGLLCGNAGSGKSTALQYLATDHSLDNDRTPLLFRARSSWTASGMLRVFCRQLGLEPKQVSVMHDRIIEHLQTHRHVLLIDEADYLFRRPMLLGLLRDINDESRTPILFAGYDDFRRRLKRDPALDRRVVRRVMLTEVSDKDLERIIKMSSDVAFSEDLRTAILDVNNRNVGRCCNAIERSHAYAHSQEWTDLDLVKVRAAQERGKVLL